MMNLKLFTAASLIAATLTVNAQKKADKKDTLNKDPYNAAAFSGLKFRSVGPALTSGRIADFAVNPGNPHEYYVAVASGGVWKTSNAGVTYTPLFDGEGSFSIGCITLDPNNPHTVWVGTGENNNQRSVAYGDGVYKSEDGGRSWKNMGLKNSEHIGNIVVDPRNSNTVYVAAYGPLWSAGGERGVYKTTDGGKTWNRVLHVSDNTGINEVHIDPRNPDILYAAAHQRRRHEFTYINGGPESAIYKGTDGGATWNKLTSGLPAGDIGRIGLAVSPVNPDYIYAIIEAEEKKGGLFRSTNRGASWEKRGDYTTSGNYYQEIFADPKDLDKIYSMDVFAMVSTDGGKTFKKLGEKYKHVDNHALWVNPNNTSHLLIGCDGGIYESFDNAATWHFKPNLPVTQFYKVEVDSSAPFYNIYGGTQDNFSLGGPSRTTSASGIVNADWFITNGGDGFESQIDPKDPNIVYAQSQYGGLVRFDRKSGEAIDIKPIEGENEAAYRWNWDAPLLLSSHSNTRLYFAANKLFRSDDRGNTWKVISPDLSRQLDRNKLPVMGKVWSMDAIGKNASTTIYGNIVALSESPLNADLLYAGTDDGLIHVTADGGKTWAKMDKFPGVPDRTYVNVVLTSQHDANTVYAAFNNHREGDFKPYILKSKDKGKTWVSVSSDLPVRGSVYSLAEDHKDPDLLFAGTEFGVFFTNDGGRKWVQLKGGLPTIAIRDMAIQKRESDLVLATFGRGFYVLDDYTPLRKFQKDLLAKEAHIFPVKEAMMFIESFPLGHKGKAFQGETFYTASNPPVGATFTYYIKDDLKTTKEKRREMEKEKYKKGEPVYYPSQDSIRAEDREEAPYLLFTVADEKGNVVRRLKAPAKKGISRLTWDFRYAPTKPVNFRVPDPDNPYDWVDMGHHALPGNYTVSLAKYENGTFSELVPAQPFTVTALNSSTLAAQDKKALQEYNNKVAELRRAISGAGSYSSELKNRIKHLKAAVVQSPKADLALLNKVNEIEQRVAVADEKLYGDQSLARREFETLPGLYSRVESIVWNLCQSTCAPTQTFIDSYTLAAKQFTPILEEMKKITAELRTIEVQLEKSGAPYTPGRLPVWNGE